MTGAAEDVEFEIIKSDGSSGRVSFTGRVAHNPDGTFKRTHCVFTEIKKNKKKTAAD